MAVYTGGDLAWSTLTEHTAKLTPEGWEVSWLPGRSFDRDSAIIAMLLVEIYVRDPPPWDEEWLTAAKLEKEINVSRRADWRG
ncbi:hypothetical protein SAMN05421835_105150 [Amycolatopsis sacchari]|uniref:Uncharacterized protein n=1 Tax=Amycolatopsis sacchari TaxID=115433 RepID=A0A1I3R4K6_9PSEU|nr:hypothetical protein [Amycolatopsis sacchari]SFJ41553.1 hypothetical protein SAMN05421835_105150 [Amycolatopsis sacchari]